MTSITQLLSPWPIAKSSSIVLRDQPEYPSPQSHTLPPLITPSYQPASEIMTANAQTGPVSPPSANSPTQTSDQSDGDTPGDGRKGYGKRELSTSKRAAQNRAAQVCVLPANLFVFRLTQWAESFPTEKRGLHKKARRASSRLSSPDRELQNCTSRELSTSGLHHQPAVQATREPARSTTSSK